MGSIGNSEMNVPYEKWGDMISMEQVGEHEYIEDSYRADKEPEHYTINKKQALSAIEEWKMDDGTYGTGDEAIYVAYANGDFLELTDGEPHKRWSKKDIVGISVSTADYQIVWGGERNNNRNSANFGKIIPYTTTEWDSNDNAVEGYSNSYSGYRTSAVWKVRVKTSFVYNKQKDRYDTVRKVIRQSTKKYE